jgi:hypothetical protein
VRAGSPEVGHRRADRGVLPAGVGVNIAGVRDLTLGRRVDAVDLGARQVLQRQQAELVGEGIHLGMLQQLVACLVDFRDRGVGLEGSLARDLLGKVFPGIEELEEAADSIEVFVGKFDLSWLSSVVSAGVALVQWGSSSLRHLR